jgi:hypothetical protein
MIPFPCGVLVVAQEPDPLARVAVQRGVDPSVSTTAPVGGGPAELTVAEYVTELPEDDDGGLAETAVVVCSGR